MKHITLAITTMTLVACGGGGSSTPEPKTSDSSVQGFYQGLTDNSSYWNVLVRSDGEFYILTQTLDSPRENFSNVIFGTATANDGNFSAPSAIFKSFSGGVTLPRNLSASYVSDEYLTGILERPEDGSGSGFTVYFDIDYQSAPTLEAISGTFKDTYKGFSGDSGESEAASISIAQDGSLVGTRPVTQGCGFVGTIIPSSTDNFFEVTISFPNSACVLGDFDLKGVAYYDPTYDQLLIAAPTAEKSGGLFFSGINLQNY